MRKVIAIIKSVAMKVAAKLLPHMKAALQCIKAIAYDARSFISRHRALMILVVGIIALVGAMVLIGLAAHSHALFDTSWKWKAALAAILTVVGFGCTVGAFVMKTMELNAALKAIAAAANVGPLGMIGACTMSDMENVPKDLFRIPVSDMGIIDIDLRDQLEASNGNFTNPMGYELVADFKKSVMASIHHHIGNDAHGISWNDFARKLTSSKKHDLPYGWQLGFLMADEVNPIVYDPIGKICDWGDLLNAIAADPDGSSWGSFSIGFTGLSDLNDGKTYHIAED